MEDRGSTSIMQNLNPAILPLSCLDRRNTDYAFAHTTQSEACARPQPLVEVRDGLHAEGPSVQCPLLTTLVTARDAFSLPSI